ncbi:hypothetical protein [Nocardioides aquiterrae]|uniref:Uncharacterized protein n=1 Tax=Nocardioides aquiterrae TaxID=203799 RepID=A0ABP4EVY7_9ACTN
MRAASSLPCERPFWTWREAIEVASRANATGRVSLRREGERWVVRYDAPLMLVNAG